MLSHTQRLTSFGTILRGRYGGSAPNGSKSIADTLAQGLTFETRFRHDFQLTRYVSVYDLQPAVRAAARSVELGIKANIAFLVQWGIFPP